MEDKTPCVWVNRVKNSLGFLQVGHRSTTFSVLFCPVVHHTSFVSKPWIKTRLNLFERRGVSLSPLSLHPLKPKSWQPRTFTDTCIPHTCLPVSGPLTVNRLILFNGSGLFFTGPWLRRQHKALRLCPALWSSFAVQSAVKWQRAAGMKTQVSSWSAKLKAGKW